MARLQQRSTSPTTSEKNDRLAIKWKGLLLASVLLLSSEAHVQAGPFTEIVAFGDSLTDTGNVYVATGGANPRSPPYYNGRYSNGPVWLERLNARLGLPAPTPSLLGGNDYAWGGAETSLGGFSHRGTPNIGSQVSLYLSTHASLNAKQAFVIWGGGNDFFNGQGDPSVPAANLASEITRLANAGAKNFIVPNLPLLGNTPAIRALGPGAQAYFNFLTSQFDSLLAAEQSSLESSLGIHIIGMDVEGLVQNVMSNPAAYGLTNVTDPALDSQGNVVPNPDQYLLWDVVHPTRVGHRILGDFAYSQVVPEPPSVTLMVSAIMGMLGWRARRWAKG